jgi:hypothetical protein
MNISEFLSIYDKSTEKDINLDKLLPPNISE